MPESSSLSAEAFERLLSEHGLSIEADDRAAALAAAGHLLALAEKVCESPQAQPEHANDTPL